MQILTKRDKQLLCQIAADNESGGHLLHKRDEDYEVMRLELSIAYTTSMPTIRQFHMLAYLTCCDWPGTLNGQYDGLTFNEFEQL